MTKEEIMKANRDKQYEDLTELVKPFNGSTTSENEAYLIGRRVGYYMGTHKNNLARRSGIYGRPITDMEKEHEDLLIPLDIQTINLWFNAVGLPMMENHFKNQYVLCQIAAGEYTLLEEAEDATKKEESN